jgi:outer membrane lipoprotein-sorting protein
MHKTLSRFAVLAALSVVFCLGSAVPSNAQGFIRELLNRMNEHNKALQSLKADVTMVKYDALLKVSDTTEGEVSYIPEIKKKQKLMMRIDWKYENGKSSEESIAVIDDKFELYRPSLKQVITGKIQQAKDPSKVNSIFGFISMPQNQLRAKYTLTVIGEEQVRSGVKAVHVELTPKMKMSYKSADLWIDVDGMPIQARIVEPNNDTRTVLLSRLRKNETIKSSIFHFDYDKRRVKEIKM